MKKIVALISSASVATASLAAGTQQEPPPAIPAATVKDVVTPIPIVKGIKQASVDEQEALILTPDQVEQIKGTTSQARKTLVSQYPNGRIAKPVARTFYIDPDVTQEPRMIRLSAGMMTTLVFTDMNGNPWYIANTAFDKGLFTDGDESAGASKSASPTNMLTIAPVKPYSYGNIMIRLEDATSPLIFTLSSGQSDENDVRIDARVSGRNPNAKPQVVALDKLPELDSVMGYFLDGVAPQGATKLRVSGVQADAWSMNGKLYVRTKASILSPAFTNHVGSADGMHVYKFFGVVPTLLASVGGKPINVSVSGN